MGNKYDFVKKKFLFLTWPQRIMVFLQCFLIVLFSILYAALSCPESGWYLFALGIFCCIVCVISVLFADDLFRWHLRFRIRDADDAEPSDWELFSRWVGWIMVTICALIYFIVGLVVV